MYKRVYFTDDIHKLTETIKAKLLNEKLIAFEPYKTQETLDRLEKVIYTTLLENL